MQELGDRLIRQHQQHVKDEVKVEERRNERQGTLLEVLERAYDRLDAAARAVRVAIDDELDPQRDDVRAMHHELACARARVRQVLAMSPDDRADRFGG